MSPHEAHIELVVVGLGGRMGQALQRAADADAHCAITGGVGRDQRDLPDALNRTVLVDFSSDQGAKIALNLAHKLRTPLLIGTTGLCEETLDTARTLSKDLPVAVVANTSLGITILRSLLESTATLLADLPGVAVTIEETHHVGKKDAPSGTALMLAETLSNRGLPIQPEGIVSNRKDEVIGTHQIRLELGDESLLLAHEALDRSLFAKGAIHLARRLLERPAGLYDAADLLGVGSRA